MIELVTINKIKETWYLSKVIVNPVHMVSITDSIEHNNLLSEGKIELPLDSNIRFTKVRMNPVTGYEEFIVVGSPYSIMEKVNKTTKQLLKG